MSGARWTCDGDVCGSCGIWHRSYAASRACSDRHHAAIQRGNTAGAYSDRRPVPVTDAARREHDAAVDAYEASVGWLDS